MEQDLTKIGRYLCLLLRHKPWSAGIQVDNHGWTEVEPFLKAVSRRYPLDRATLEEIVRTDEKQRYSFSEDGLRIRANQGHSIPVDVEPERMDPPECLWHGTAERFAPSIEAEGIKHMNRLYVHLSPDPETAVRVGKRHGEPLVFRVDTAAMARDGYVFYRAVNGVWLTKYVPPYYLTRTE